MNFCLPYSLGEDWIKIGNYGSYEHLKLWKLENYGSYEHCGYRKNSRDSL